MKPTREQCLEWAIDCDLKVGQHWNKDHMDTKNMLNLILRAYAEGQKDMREMAAKICDTTWNGDSDTYLEAEAYNESAEKAEPVTWKMKGVPAYTDVNPNSDDWEPRYAAPVASSEDAPGYWRNRQRREDLTTKHGGISAVRVDANVRGVATTTKGFENEQSTRDGGRTTGRGKEHAMPSSGFIGRHYEQRNLPCCGLHHQRRSIGVCDGHQPRFARSGGEQGDK